MELDAMQAIWARQGEQMEQTLRLNRQLLERVQRGAVEVPLRRFVALVGAGVFLAVVGMGWLAPWIVSHWWEPEFALPAVAMYAWLLGTVVFAVRQMVMALRMDWSRPVLELQREMEALHAFRMWGVKWALLTGQVVWWVPALVVLGKAWAGVDLYAVCGWPFLGLNLAFSVAVVPVALWAIRRGEERWGGAAWWQQMRRDVVGMQMTAARAALEELAQFEKE